jgi:RNA polymerase sigma factor (sigma-70 family)
MQATIWSDTERRRLVRLCASISGDRDAAEDLAQETLLEAWRNQHKLVDPAGADRWVSAVARNVCLRWTSRRRDLPVAELPEQPVEAEVELGRDDLAEILDGALALLPAMQREVLLENVVFERSNGEIADRLGISPDAVSMRLTRGKLALRRLIDAEEWKPTGVWCVSCGDAKLVTRREQDGTAIAFRCPGCDPAGRAAVFPLDNPFFATLVGGLSRPTAIFGRVADWALGYWSAGDGSHPSCTRCGADVTVQALTRTDLRQETHGLFVRCSSCGEEVWSSLVGVAMAAREVRELRRRVPRTRAQTEERRDAIVVRFAERQVAFDRRSFRLLAIT